MKVEIVWKEEAKRATATYYCVSKTSFVPVNGPVQFLRLDLEEGTDIRIIFFKVDDIESVYMSKI